VNRWNDITTAWMIGYPITAARTSSAGAMYSHGVHRSERQRLLRGAAAAPATVVIDASS
jgi:hypothetical protein